MDQKVGVVRFALSEQGSAPAYNADRGPQPRPHPPGLALLLHHRQAVFVHEYAVASVLPKI